MLRGSSCGHRVRAMLGGGVRLASSFVPEDAQNELESRLKDLKYLEMSYEDVVNSFLADLGYGNGQWLPAAAKFWAHNGLGLLTVFPSQFAIHAVREAPQRRKELRALRSPLQRDFSGSPSQSRSFLFFPLSL